MITKGYRHHVYINCIEIFMHVVKLTMIKLALRFVATKDYRVLEGCQIQKQKGFSLKLLCGSM